MNEMPLYNRILDYLLNIPLVAYIVLICVILSAIPQIRDGIKSIFHIIKPKKKDFVIKYTDEVISFEELVLSHDFDIIRINATTHSLGVNAEYQWVKYKYPGSRCYMQTLQKFHTNKGDKIFDILHIEIGPREKDIYFDISNFYSGAPVSFTKDINPYVTQKIQNIYN